MANDPEKRRPAPLFPYVKDPETGKVRITDTCRERLRRLLGREVRIETEKDLALAVIDGLMRAIYSDIRGTAERNLERQNRQKE